jgi:hypothetical protein
MNDLDELKAEWFEFGRKSGIKEAEERIIKLLEANCYCHTAMVKGYVKKYVCPAYGFIARIKADSNV